MDIHIPIWVMDTVKIIGYAVVGIFALLGVLFCWTFKGYKVR